MAAAIEMAATAAIALLRMLVIGYFLTLEFLDLFRVNHVAVSEDDRNVIIPMCNPSHRGIFLPGQQVRIPLTAIII